MHDQRARRRKRRAARTARPEAPIPGPELFLRGSPRRLLYNSPMSAPDTRNERLRKLTRWLARGDVRRAQETLDADAARAAREAPAAEPVLAEPLSLERACPGRVADGAFGPYWHIERALADISAAEVPVAREYAHVMSGARQRFDELSASPELCHVSVAGPGDLLFMDTETCGFAGSVVFLVGLMSFRDGGLVFDQFLARDYAEERAVLGEFSERLAAACVLVTFNGKAFDMNMIRDRSVFLGLPGPDREPPHLDLLHEARRRWRRDLPNCKLQTLEAMLCGRHRTGDIPGAAIPDAYHDFVATGDARRLRDILHHNLLDLLTMAQLISHLLTGH